MTFIKALLFPLAVCVALLMSEYELWSLDEYWGGASDNAFSPPAIGCNGKSAIAIDAGTCLLCLVVAPADDDDAGGD
jgi:hypothetical protein